MCSQVAIETIYVAIQTIVYALLLYSMIGYHWDAGKFFYFYYFIFMAFTYFSMYGMMLVALTPGRQIAAIMMAFLLNFWNLFSGFLIPRPVSMVTIFHIPLTRIHISCRVCVIMSFTNSLYYILQLIPVWWRWYYWCSPVAWTIYGVFASQFGDIKTQLEIPGESTKPEVSTYLRDSLGFDHDFLVPVIIAHIGWVLVFFFVFAYGIKVLNFQKR